MLGPAAFAFLAAFAALTALAPVAAVVLLVGCAVVPAVAHALNVADEERGWRR